MNNHITTELLKQGFKEYQHKTGFYVWSKTDLLKNDDKKEWYLT